MITAVRCVQPMTAVVQEVMHARRLVIPGMKEESKCRGKHSLVHRVAGAALQADHGDRQPRDVVYAISARSVGNGAVRVLNDADIVDEVQQMIRLDLW